MPEEIQKNNRKQIKLEDLEKGITHSRRRPNTKPPTSRTKNQSNENESNTQSNNNSSTEE